MDDPGEKRHRRSMEGRGPVMCSSRRWQWEPWTTIRVEQWDRLTCVGGGIPTTWRWRSEPCPTREMSLGWQWSSQPGRRLVLWWLSGAEHLLGPFVGGGIRRGQHWRSVIRVSMAVAEWWIAATAATLGRRSNVALFCTVVAKDSKHRQRRLRHSSELAEVCWWWGLRYDTGGPGGAPNEGGVSWMVAEMQTGGAPSVADLGERIILQASVRGVGENWQPHGRPRTEA
ncbi:hypothetical protein NDU88_002598 [Pleurodeles waltl]|uniref:Uncharacterized protein n=1 Tax=Pleurodeles waltl TaxID=8319 RepID=A0AAV7L3Z0_PLEWA|nr:hypothetical protein NDU88_002598 [Pleurodeles waltl]